MKRNSWESGYNQHMRKQHFVIAAAASFTVACFLAGALYATHRQLNEAQVVIRNVRDTPAALVRRSENGRYIEVWRGVPDASGRPNVHGELVSEWQVQDGEVYQAPDEILAVR